MLDLLSAFVGPGGYSHMLITKVTFLRRLVLLLIKQKQPCRFTREDKQAILSSVLKINCISLKIPRR